MYTSEQTLKLSKLANAVKEIAVSTTRDNANVGNNFSAKLLQMASAANKTVVSFDIPERFMNAHDNGRIHIHDLDAYNLTINCLNVDTGKALKGFNTGYGTIKQATHIESAASIACIILQSTQNDMFGGQGHVDFDNDLADYLQMTEENIRIQVAADYMLLSGVDLDDVMTETMQAKIEKMVETKLRKAAAQAMQITVYNLNSMHSRAGAQIPFSSINVGIPKNKYAAMICEHLLREYNKGLGKGEQPIFPNIVFRVKAGVNLYPSDPYYYLYQLACEVAANRMNPTFLNLDSTFNKPAYDRGVLPATMGCRTRILDNINGESTPKGRGNIAPVSINLVAIALDVTYGLQSAGSPIERFYDSLRDTLELCEDQLMHRYHTLAQLKCKDIPFIAGQEMIMGSEGLDKEDSIEPILKNGTWAIGFIGLAEALTQLCGKHHGEDDEAYQVGLNIVKFIRDFCDEAKQRRQLNFTCYATPAEGLSGRFTKIDQELYGSIKGVTDHEFYTNSFHIPVDQNISITEKIRKEAPFHALCNAGHITYIELDSAPVDAPSIVEKAVTYAFTNTDMGYMGINFGIRYCLECGMNHVLGSTCPNCGGHDFQGIHRVTGYLSLDERLGDGKKAEVCARISHV